MPIDPAKALAAEPLTSQYSWDQDDVILYHLGLGAGWQAPTDQAELAWVYENGLKVLPSFGVLAPFSALFGLNNLDGVDINMMLVLHGEQELEVHAPIPTEGTVTNTARIAEVQDKGKAAVVVLEVDSALPDGTKLFTNRSMIFARGEGGFGGEPGTSVSIEPPDREPDAEFSSPTLPHQALIYRLSGDKNPLHADPQFAQMAGFDRPILHGLATYGVVLKAVVDGMLGGDPTKVTSYRVRFAGVVFPGETIVTRAWHTDAGIVVTATTAERGEPVLTNALVGVAS
jgi:acyl dehydratase